MTTAPRTRTVQFEACFNVRDLGGYGGLGGRPVRWGVVYRADGLHRLTGDDLKRFCRLGMRTVIDLRTAGEVRALGSFRTDVVPLDRVHLPMTDGLAEPPSDATVPTVAQRGESYADLAGRGAAMIVAALHVLADEQRHPAVFHCAAGRDRTGILAAILLDLVGVSDAEIVADYVLTQEVKEQTDAWAEANDPITLELWTRYPDDLRNTRAETMATFLAMMRHRHGSLGAFVDGAGFAPHDLERLSSALLGSGEDE